MRLDRRWAALVWLVTALTALPLLCPGWLPFTDLGEHAAAMGTFAHWSAPGYGAEDHYAIAWTSSQYLLVHALGGLLARLVGVESAVKLLLVALAVSWVAATRLLLRAAGSDERLAVFAALLFWNRALGLGFLPYLASLPLFLVTLAGFLRWPAPRRRRRGLALALASVAVFYTHASAFTLLAATTAAVGAARFRGLRHLARDLAPLVPATALAAA